MRRAGPIALLPLLLGAAPALAETCSRSTLASQDYAYARWCGDPAAGGTLRVARRDGRSAEYAGVPVDVYRELIRTHRIQHYLSTEVEPRYRRTGASAPPPTAAQREAAPAARPAPGPRPVVAEMPIPPIPPVPPRR